MSDPPILPTKRNQFSRGIRKISMAKANTHLCLGNDNASLLFPVRAERLVGSAR